MGKGLRSSRNKSNKSKLRSDVFGPAEHARKERLSAKLNELVSKPQPEPKDTKESIKLTAGDRVTIQEITDGTEAHGPAGEENMDIDAANPPGLTAESSVSRGTSRTQKRGRRKRKATMVFPISIKGKRLGTGLRARETKTRLKR